MEKVEGEKMRQFLNEYQYSVGARSFVSLPNPSQLPYKTVTMPIEQLVKLRNDMLLLTKFAALMCKVPEDKLSHFDLLAPFLKMATDLSDLDEELRDWDSV